jgi:N6-adenosine-specific RNA methylase IME4
MLNRTDPFGGLPRAKYRAILADPPWRFQTWDKQTAVRVAHSSGCTDARARDHYRTMTVGGIKALPVGGLAADDCALFLWITWPQLEDALSVIAAWGFRYKTCAFAWTKTRKGHFTLYDDNTAMGLGYWTRANTEVCLLATRGRPKRLHKGVRQAIIEPRREHSRKPDCAHDRIERLVAGPYLELFARARRRGWDAWGDGVDIRKGEQEWAR